MCFLHKAKLLGILDHVNYSTKFLKKRHANCIFSGVLFPSDFKAIAAFKTVGTLQISCKKQGTADLAIDLNALQEV